MWGSVCSTGWDNTDAFVTCKYLGYGNAGEHTHFPIPDEGNFVPDVLVCLQNQLCTKTRSMERDRDPLLFPMCCVKDGSVA